jgi:hypothetical protein
MRDLRSPRWILAKAALFVVIGMTAAALVLVDHPNVRTAALLLLAIWAFCRAYYFAFYVIEKYLDPGYRFSGLGSALRHLLQRRP